MTPAITPPIDDTSTAPSRERRVNRPAPVRPPSSQRPSTQGPNHNPAVSPVRSGGSAVVRGAKRAPVQGTMPPARRTVPPAQKKVHHDPGVAPPASAAQSKAPVAGQDRSEASPTSAGVATNLISAAGSVLAVVVSQLRSWSQTVSETVSKRVDSRKPAEPVRPDHDGTGTRTGGVAPTVRPPTRWSRLRQGRLLERRGFVPLSPGRAKRRHRILPRSAIGISFMLLSVGMGAAFAGAGFYAYYDNRLAANEAEIARFVEGFDTQFVDASESLNQLRSDSLDQIRQELQPLGEYVSEQNGVVNLPAQVGESVYQLRTNDENGRVVAGAAAAVADHRGGTALVTSYSLVKAGTRTPGPGIELIKGDEVIAATLWSWDAERDLALVVVDESLPRLNFATEEDQNAIVGARVFAMSGTGGQGATASPGAVLDRSAAGLQHTATIGSMFNGGPLVNSAGELVGIASTAYSPLGIDGGEVRFAADLAGLCSDLLNCADPVSPESTDAEPASD